MKRIWPLLTLGVVAYLVFAIATLPANAVLSRLAPMVNAAGVEGSIWNGRAQLLQAGNIAVGGASWNLHGLPLLLGRAQADVKITRSDGFAQTLVTVNLFGGLRLDQTTASLPLAALPPTVIPGGWRGTLNLKLKRLVLDQGWPVQATGTVEVLDLVGPARQPHDMGSYKITFAKPAADAGLKARPGDGISGAVVDLGGPLQVAGTLQLKPERQYLLAGNVLARPGAPASVARTLQFLGPPAADGSREFSLSGTL